jgi:hypothetical protein
MNTETTTRRPRLPRRARRGAEPRALRERPAHAPDHDERSDAASEPSEALATSLGTAPTANAPAPAPAAEAVSASDSTQDEEFVWTPARRVSVLAALVWIHCTNPNGDPERPRLSEAELLEREEVKPTFNGLNNALRAGLARNPGGNWHLTPEGIEQLREHDLLETWSVTPIPA